MPEKASRLMGRKHGRLEARIRPEQKALLERAAMLQGQSLSDFVIGSAQRAAEQVIRDHEVIRLSVEDSRAVVEALLNPPEPNEQLRKAAEEYQRLIVNPIL